jgi:hypothetical protein
VYGGAVESFEMLRQLEGCLNLEDLVSMSDLSVPQEQIQTFFNGTSSGPSGILAAFVPGRILRDAPSSKFGAPSMPCWLGAPAVGDLGPSWSSAIGGGLGSRGDLAGDAIVLIGGGVRGSSGVCGRFNCLSYVSRKYGG